jgi:hypothetical protein
MKRFLLIMIISFTSFASLQAQEYNREKRTEKILALKIAFITQKLDLTADEAQRFWPVYNRYETEIRQVMTDNKSVGDAIDNEEKVLNVKKKYKPEFIKVIGQPRTNTLFNAEREFRGVLMRQLKNKQGQQNR